MLLRLFALACIPLLWVAPLSAAEKSAPAKLQLWRLDCGQLWVANLDDMSDTHAHVGQSLRVTSSCYLLRHGNEYLLWDAGLPHSDLGKPLTQGKEDSETLAVTIVQQLAQIGVRPAQIGKIGISHYHFDHIGQAEDFPQATLLIGRNDFELLSQPDHAWRAKQLGAWMKPGARTQRVAGDLDVFGDGSVIMLALPGHTPGHHGLLVMLPKLGPVLLSGDVAHFRENLESSGVPSYNTDRAQSLASMARYRELGSNLKATVIIQHDERDITKLPPFPQAAE